jgi:hypothetical protein
MRAKMKYICKKFINHQIKKCLLFRCRHAVVYIMQTLNWTNQCPLFMTVRHTFEISEDDHPRTVTHARAHWWTLDLANAFVSPGVNSRGELVPSHGASRRQLGDNVISIVWQLLLAIKFKVIICIYTPLKLYQPLLWTFGTPDINTEIEFMVRWVRQNSIYYRQKTRESYSQVNVLNMSIILFDPKV